MNEATFLKTKFREHYTKHNASPPPDFEKREFGVGKYGRKIYKRHLSFKSMQGLKDFLMVEAPLYISVSPAYYANVDERSMDQKGWMFTDLVYEFDANDLDTDCKEKHDTWFCKTCNRGGHGVLAACSECGNKTQVNSWYCDVCLEATKQETFSLVEGFLKPDFGFSDNEISINASGNRGFHTYVRSEVLKELDKGAVIELMNYLLARNINPACHGFDVEGKLFKGPKGSDLGWRGRMARAVIDYMKVVDYREFGVDFGYGPTKSKRMLEGREGLISRMQEGYWDQFKGVKPEVWSRIAEKKAVAKGSDFDVQASVDVKKIMRLPGSLHGSTGLIASLIGSIRNLDKFDPLKDTVAFKSGSVNIITKGKVPEFRLLDEMFGPFDDKHSVELPTCAAVYLVARGSAELVV